MTKAFCYKSLKDSPLISFHIGRRDKWTFKRFWVFLGSEIWRFIGWMEINPWTEVTTFHFLSDRRAAFGKANQTHAM